MPLGFIALAVFLVCIISAPVFAYVGPGLGAGIIGVILGIIASFFLALFAILWYPLKKMIRRFRNSGTRPDESTKSTDDGRPR